MPLTVPGMAALAVRLQARRCAGRVSAAIRRCIWCMAAVTFRRPRERHSAAYCGRVSTESTSAAVTSAAPSRVAPSARLSMDNRSADAPATKAAACDVPAWWDSGEIAGIAERVNIHITSIRPKAVRNSLGTCRRTAERRVATALHGGGAPDQRAWRHQVDRRCTNVAVGRNGAAWFRRTDRDHISKRWAQRCRVDRVGVEISAMIARRNHNHLPARLQGCPDDWAA